MQRLRNLLLVSTVLMPLGLTSALAGPNGATVVGGSASVQNQGTANVIVNQFSDKAVINWNLFNIGVGEKTTFIQPNSNSIALNKVTGGMGPSQILGSLDANGKVFIINRDGFIFGAGAVVNTAGFLATTSDIKNEDFMAGRFNFNIPGRPDASIVNMGTITATNGGFAALVAPGVRNSGTITATLGTVTLAAGNTFSLDFYGDKLVTLGVGDQIAGQVKDVATGQTLKSLVTNEGKLKANGGRVELTAAAARQVVDSVINTSGVIEANSIGTKNGQIVLSAATGAPATSGSATRGGASTTTSTLPPQKVKVSGTLSASGKDKGTKGGTIIVTGEHIEVAGATIDASGADGGGKVMIGGDWAGGKPDKSLVNNQSAVLESFSVPTATTVSVDAATRIDASAKDRGDGGKVVLWADNHLSFTGTILALGGKEFGNGGFIETSAHAVDVSGTINAGKGGLWLLDPADLTINSGLAATINASLNAGTDVTQQTATSGPGNGDIIVTSQISWNTSATLTLIAFHNIQINDAGPIAGTIVNTGGAAGKLVMHADSTGTGFGTIVMPAGTTSQRINWTGSTGTVTVYYNPTVFGTQDNFTVGNGHIGLATPSQLTQYMLVNTETKLQNMGVNLAGNYALSKDINAGSIPNFVPIGNTSPNFTGIFDGQNHTISNLHIAPVNPVNFGISVGMFSTIGATGVVKNLTIDQATVTANPNATGPGQFVGVLAGTNAGLVSNVNVTNSTVSHGTAQNGVIAGGLVGQNGLFGPGAHMGTITLSNALLTNVSVGSSTSGSSGNSAGGLVGDNPGTITFSTASGNVSGGTNSFIGGLVGRNENPASIISSAASGNVTLSDATGAGAGGLVGFNFGVINSSVATGNVTGGNSSDIFKAGAIGGLVGLNDAAGTIVTSFAGGSVSAGSKSSAGGLVGFNNGTITGSGATGAVSSLDNFAGGLVGFNGFGATITSSVATGNVSGGGFNLGGFAGDNAGTITGSSALGNVVSTAPTTAHEGNAGGFAGNNSGSISFSFATGNVTSNNNAGGFVGSNGGTIDTSFAGFFGFGGTVTVGNNGTAGGFVGGNHGTITNSGAFGNVSGGSNSVLGGFAAGNLDGKISDSTASGAVTANGANSVVGGFAGVNTSDLVRVTSSGPVTGTSDSYLGGLVGLNLGLIQDSTSSSSVTGSGANNIAGGLVGLNFGLVDPSTSSGNVSSGANSIVGGLIGANGALRFPDGFTLVGTRTSDSTASGTASGGAGSTVGPQVGQDYPTAGLPNLPERTCDNGGQFCGGTLFNPNGSQQPTPDQPKVPQTEPIVNLVMAQMNDVFTEKKADEVVNTTTTTAPGSPGSPGGQKGNQKGAGGQAGRPPAIGFAAYGLGPLPSGMPPLNETRFLSNETVMQIGGKISPDELAAFARKLGLEITYRETVALLGRTVIRFRITSGMPVRDVIAAGEAELGKNFSFQPSYAYNLVQDVAQAPSPADTNRKGDSAQYIVEKLGLPEAHLIATGKTVKVAVIDSEIDSQHPDLEGAVTGSYDALPSDDQTAHPHGTGMAGAIASHKRLLGVAPGAQLLAIRAFGVSSGGAQGTSLNIVKGLQWAVDQGAKVINMSFAGPRDPILAQAMKRLTDQGIILIGAAGNAGPKSPPLFPGADPNVIAVSATDVDDKTYKNANRGKYIAIAAPGVDILVPAPEGGYQLTTGTSVAAAHISGVVALMLERNKELRPAEVRAILAATAKKTGGAATDVGAGLVDPVQALSKAGPKVTQLRR
jgi:filamentous hemagglutinin family protein